MKRRQMCIAAAFLGMTLVFGSAQMAGADEVNTYDDYVSAVNEGMQQAVAEEAYSAPEYSETEAFTDADAEAENNDGDDTYISNNGTVFQIPRVDVSNTVFDYCATFTAEQIETIRDQIAAINKRIDGQVLILVTKDIPTDANYSTETTMRYSRQFYIDNQAAEDGFIYTIDLNNRVMWLAGHGKFATEEYSQMGDDILNDAYDDAKRGDYFQVTETAIDHLDRIGNKGRAAKPTLMSLIISAFASLLGILGFTSKHKHTQPSRANTPAIAVDSYRSVRHDEQYLGTTVMRHRISDDDDHRGGSSHGEGFGGVSSGGFSSGGGSFSGGGGHF